MSFAAPGVPPAWRNVGCGSEVVVREAEGSVHFAGTTEPRIAAVESVLIANRGEIAVRIIRAARDLGLRTIAIYSELDRDSVHAGMADEAWNVGPAPAAESYLNIERILEIAKESNADAVHPGYGFLAENATFAQAVSDAGLIWVGPPASAIQMMGDKIESRLAAESAGVPGVPGTLEPLTSVSQVEEFAAEHGFPVAIKASAGGGGRGMKVVHEGDDLAAAFESASREAESWFGNPEVYVERYLENARHIEAQVIFDTEGHGVFYGERDCSLQRRHRRTEPSSEGSPSHSVQRLDTNPPARSSSCSRMGPSTSSR